MFTYFFCGKVTAAGSLVLGLLTAYFSELASSVVCVCVSPVGGVLVSPTAGQITVWALGMRTVLTSTVTDGSTTCTASASYATFAKDTARAANTTTPPTGPTSYGPHPRLAQSYQRV